MSPVISIQNIPEGELTVFSNGDFSLVRGDPDDTNTPIEIHQRGFGPVHLQEMALSILEQKGIMLAPRRLPSGGMNDLIRFAQHADQIRRESRLPVSVSGRFVEGRLVESRIVDISPEPTTTERSTTPSNRGIFNEETRAERDVNRSRNLVFDEARRQIRELDVREPLNAVTFFLGPISALRAARVGSQVGRGARVARASRARTAGMRALDQASTVPRLNITQQTLRSRMLLDRVNPLHGFTSRHGTYLRENPAIVSRLLDRLKDARASIGATEEGFRGSNLAVAAVEIEGQVVIIHQTNRIGLHSEPWLIGLAGQIRHELRTTDVKILAILTERSPCRECRRRLYNAARQIGDAAILHLVQYNPGRNAEELVRAYGLL